MPLVSIAGAGATDAWSDNDDDEDDGVTATTGASSANATKGKKSHNAATVNFFMLISNVLPIYDLYN
jgi:hypothetical protein